MIVRTHHTRSLAITLLAVLLVVSMVSTAGCERVAAIGEDFYDEGDATARIAATVAKAKASGKRPLLIFGGDWCVWCKALHRQMRSDKELAALIEARYEMLSVDVGTNKGLDKIYGEPFQYGFPVLVVLTPEGHTAHIQTNAMLEIGGGKLGHDRAKVLAFLQRFQDPKTPGSHAAPGSGKLLIP